jgi:hypothetical protein
MSHGGQPLDISGARAGSAETEKKLSGEPLTPAPEDFDSLIADLLENPEKILTGDLTPEQVMEVQKRLNPYAGIAGAPPREDHKRVAACSYTNLREDYLRRFTATSLIGFLFQMLHEWEVPAEARRWVPAAKKKASDDPAFQPFTAGMLVELLEGTLAIAKEAQAASQGAQETRRAALAADASLPADAGKTASLAGKTASLPGAADRSTVEGLYQSAEMLDAKSAGLLYTATHAMHRNGVDAGNRLKSTADAGMKFQMVKDVLKKFPAPAPPGQIEMPASTAKAVIDGFLHNLFVFDPSVHARSGHDAKKIAEAVEKVVVSIGGTETRVAADTKDPGHLPLEVVRGIAPKPAPEHREAVRAIMSAPAAYNAVVALLRDEDLLDVALQAFEQPDVFRHYLLPVSRESPARPAAERVPPQDVFHRWNYYTEVNHEELRTITEAIYPERPDLDWALALWETFEGTQKQIDEGFEKFCQRYQDEVPSSIKALEFGCWSLLADFKENRKKIQFYNKHTDVLKRILDRHAEDKRVGAELMRNRVKQTKAKNIAQDGPDAPGLGGYRRELARAGQDLGAHGAERVISQEEMKRLEKAKGSIKAAQELELLEQTEKRIAELSSLEKLRKIDGLELTLNETEELKKARGMIGKIREMIEVPDDAIQVDVFTSDAVTGEFGKTHFYTRAEAPPEPAAETGRKGAPTGHPAVLASEAGARARGEPPASAAPPPSAAPPSAAPPRPSLPVFPPLTPPVDVVAGFAPFVVDQMMHAEQRSAAERHAEALQDAQREKTT